MQKLSVVEHSSGAYKLGSHQNVWNLLRNKLRQIGSPNQIIDNSDSKLSEFNCRLWYDSNSNKGFESRIAILIKFRSVFRLNFDLFFNLNLIQNYWLKDQNYPLKDRNYQLKDQKFQN